MSNIKKEAINIISNLPDSVAVEEIMYHLYVLDIITKGQKAIENKEYITLESLRKEIETW